MFKQTNKDFDDIIKAIPDNFKVVDIGASSAPTRRADYIIDIVPYEGINLKQLKGPGEVRFSKERYVQHDICSRKPFPFPDKFFDYAICSHTLEDIRDPIGVLDEIVRVSKAGYVEIPSRMYETSYGIEGKHLAGNVHHRWIIDIFENRLRFTFKFSWVHLPFVARKKMPQGKDRVLQIEWSDSLDYYENFLNSGPEIIKYYTGKEGEKEVESFYRKLFGKNYLISKIEYFYKKSPGFKKLADTLKLKKTYKQIFKKA